VLYIILTAFLISSFWFRKSISVANKGEFLLVHKKIVVMCQMDGWMDE